MCLAEAMEQKGFSIYRLSKISMIPYATLNDICNGKTSLGKCNAETVYRIAQALEVPMEELIESSVGKRAAFENFKSTVCHRLREKGDIDFLIETLKNNEIRTCYTKKWYPESLYLLAMLDYISRENGIPLCAEYDDLRCCRLEKPLYPAGVLAICTVKKDDTPLKQAEQQAIPEFRRFNIIECEVRNVV